MRRATGFTLVELVTSLIILAIVSVGISGFIRSSMQIFNDVTEREQLLGDSQFAVERLTREIRNAIPNSVRLAGDASVHCLQYIPIDYSTFYLQLPQLPSSDTQLTVVEMGDINGNALCFLSTARRSQWYTRLAVKMFTIPIRIGAGVSLPVQMMAQIRVVAR